MCHLCQVVCVCVGQHDTPHANHNGHWLQKNINKMTYFWCFICFASTVLKGHPECLKCGKILWWPGLRPWPAGGSYSALPDTLAGGDGAGWRLPKNPTPLSALRASNLGHSGIAPCLPNSSVATVGHVSTLPQPCWVMGFAQIRSFFFWGDRGIRRDGGRTRQQTCVEKHLTAANCLYRAYIWLLGASPQNSTGTPPLAPAGRLPSPRSSVPTLTSEPGYATAALIRLLISAYVVNWTYFNPPPLIL